MTDLPETTLLDARDIKRLAPVSDMSIWRWVKAGEFPRPIKISRRNYWRSDEISAWLEQQSAARSAA